MKPIAQTFYVSGTPSEVPGVFITKVAIYFKKVSTRYPVELQIRTTLNGVPTPERLPFGTKRLWPASDTNPTTFRPVASDDATVPTYFEFDTPVFVESAKSYAIVLDPIGGYPDYEVWVGEISKPDVSALGSLISVNNDTGDLFLSSNDRSWIPVITEDMKFKIYIAKFVDSAGLPVKQGQAVVRSPDEDYFEITGIVGDLMLGEPLYPSNTVFTYSGSSYNFPNSLVTLADYSGSFSVGDTVYQTIDGNVTDNPAATKIASGKVYSADLSGARKTLGISDITGPFLPSYKIYNLSNPSVSKGTVSSSPNPIQINTTTAGSNNVVVPDSAVFNVNDVIAISTNNYSKTEIVKVDSVVATRTSAGDIIQTNNNISFTDSGAIINKLVFNGTLKGGLGGRQDYFDFTRIIVDNVTSTESNNFTSAIGGRIIGAYSKASAVIHDVVDMLYNQMTPHIAHIAPSNTSIDWTFTGVKSDEFNTDGTINTSPAYANDSVIYSSNKIKINEGSTNEFIDYQRTLMSRSNEFVKLPSGRKGERTVNIFANLVSENTLISPTLDIISKYSTFTRNLCEPTAQTMGYYLGITNNNGIFKQGDLVTQGTTTGNVQFANSSFVRVTTVSGSPSPYISIVANTQGVDAANDCINITNADQKFNVNDYIFYGVPTGNTAIGGLTKTISDIVYTGNTFYYIESVNSTAITLKATLTGTKINLTESRSTNPGQVHYLVSNASIGFLANTTSIVKTSCTSINATVSSATYYSDSYENGYFRSSRYISKNVILADSAEDILAYLATYRPAGTDLQVYAKIKHDQDSQTWKSKHWSRLSEITPATLLSSSINIDDQLELQYGFPKSVNLFPSSTTCLSTSTLVSVFSTADLFVGQFVYINDVTNQLFNVRQITSIVDSSRITVDTPPSFSTTTAAFGTIPISSRCSAFLNDQNSNIVRYVTDDDHVYDSYSQFAMKIVPVCSSSAIVPRVSDMRVLALQV